jgi:hypothetical protein
MVAPDVLMRPIFDMSRLRVKRVSKEKSLQQKYATLRVVCVEMHSVIVPVVAGEARSEDSYAGAPAGAASKETSTFCGESSPW